MMGPSPPRSPLRTNPELSAFPPTPSGSPSPTRIPGLPIRSWEASRFGPPGSWRFAWVIAFVQVGERRSMQTILRPASGSSSDSPLHTRPNPPQHLAEEPPVLAPVAVDRSPSPPRSWAKTAGSPQVHLALVHDSKLTVNDPNPEASHRPILYDSGRPSSVIWFRTLHATTDSATRPPRDRARSRSPRIDLYRKNAFSTRAWRW